MFPEINWLFPSIEANKIDAVKNPANQKFINQPNDLGETPLIKAVQNNNVPICEYLIEAGADINHQDLNKNTPLTHAFLTESHECSLLLLSKGADINIPNTSASLAMHHLNFTDSKGRSPLIIVLLNENFFLLKELLERGANPYLGQDENQRTFFQIFQNKKNIINPSFG